MRRFLSSNIGIASLAAIIIIGLSVYAKARMSAPAKPNLQAQIGLIADNSVKSAIQNGESTNLDGVLGTTTIDERIAALQAKSASTSDENLTPTDRFAREFFSEYMSLKASGAPIDQNTGTDLVNQLLSQDYGTPSSEKLYSISDIHVLSTDSLSALKAYGNALGAIINAPLPQGYESELVILSKAQDGDSSDLPKLPIDLARYQRMQAEILALPVPDPLKGAQIALINSLAAIIEGVKGMTLVNSDPVGATRMIASYQDGIHALPLPLEIIKDYFQKQDISFSSDESGYVLTQ